MNHQSGDFISRYLAYTEHTEPPRIFHRWAAISAIGAMMGRGTWYQLGHFTVYPNLYVMLVGESASRKSTSIKMVKRLVRSAGYEFIAPERVKQEKFLMELAGMEDGEHILGGTNGHKGATNGKNILEQNLWGTEMESNSGPSEIFVMADEFNDFLGLGNMDFISLLGTLWDYEGLFRHKLKNSKSVMVPDPTVSILGGNTPSNMKLAFPPETIGQGFFSRLLLVFSDPSGRKIAEPPEPCPDETAWFVTELQRIRAQPLGKVSPTQEARKLIAKIYEGDLGITDVRFKSYVQKRHNQLLKLCLIVVAARAGTKVELQDVIFANTMLTHAESFMHKAMGEYGKARHSDVSHKVVALLEGAPNGMALRDLWPHVRRDLDSLPDLGKILANLLEAEAVMYSQGVFLAKRRTVKALDPDTVDWKLLTKEERMMTI